MRATKAIVADPLRLYELGLRNLMDMAILVHIGRCGIIGCQRTAIAAHMKVAYETARSGVDRLCDMGLLTPATQDYGPGRPLNYVCTLRGWKLLTEPADFSLFPWAQTPLKLLADMEAESKWEHDKTAPVLKDAFGRKRNLQLGIPSGEKSHRLFDVPMQLAGSVIRAHIAAKQTELTVANERARIELDGPTSKWT